MRNPTMKTKRKQDSQHISVQDLRDDICTLNDAELELIAGGKVSMQDFHFVTVVNKSTPVLN